MEGDGGQVEGAGWQDGEGQDGHGRAGKRAEGSSAAGGLNLVEELSSVITSQVGERKAELAKVRLQGDRRRRGKEEEVNNSSFHQSVFHIQ